ncbi:MAG: flagellin [Verrucomicrobia bacterium GWC2_42_7]|nr:MAG: flagellin [Verrucomicrobia bacterium GWC2_42_7]
MALVINTNIAAASAAITLQSSNTMLQKSLQRLSSGIRIVDPADDAGGLAVSMKMQSAIRRNSAVQSTIGNAISFLQTQDGALKTSGDILNRISELRALYSDVTKSASDKTNYNKEFLELKQQLTSLISEKFNGVTLFGSTSPGSVVITEDGTQSVALSAADLSSAIQGVTSASGLSGVSIGGTTSIIATVASMRAVNGAQSSRLQFAVNMLTVNATNLSSANSRIIDTDVASESTSYAKFQILSQSGAAMLAQANTISQVALKLIGN